jgi:hypothetical protein
MENCRTKSCQKLFVFEEKRSKLTLENVKEVESEIIKVDGCEISDQTARCDYLLTTEQLEMYVELKGQDINHAIIQIESTIERLSTGNRAKRAYIICARVPMASPELQMLALQAKKRLNYALIVKSSGFRDKY